MFSQSELPFSHFASLRMKLDNRLWARRGVTGGCATKPEKKTIQAIQSVTSAIYLHAL